MVVGWSIDSPGAAALVSDALGLAVGARRVVGAGIHTIAASGQHRRRSGRQTLESIFRRRWARLYAGSRISAAGRRPPPSALPALPADARRAGERDLRVPRYLPRPPAPSCGAWHVCGCEFDTRVIRTWWPEVEMERLARPECDGVEILQGCHMSTPRPRRRASDTYNHRPSSRIDHRDRIASPTFAAGGRQCIAGAPGPH